MKRILIIAGEVSSDMHAANLVNDIRSLDKDMSFFGLGGERMQASGIKLLENIVHLAFIGPGGLFKSYIALKNIYNSLIKHICDDPPDCAILIDYAEFNLRVARELKKLGVPIIYYISPQVWAWGLWRINTIRRLVDKMLVFFEFEEKLYTKHGVDTTFVGHPLLNIVKPTESKDEVLKRLSIDKDAKIVGILPGSRISEIKTILPIMLDSAKLILQRYKQEQIEFVLPLASTIDEEYIRGIISKTKINIKIIKSDVYNAISICDCAVVTSGTATLETAVLNVPMAIVYKTNFLTYILTKNVIKLPFIGLVNIVAGEKIVPEFLQYQARPDSIAEYIVSLLKDKNILSSIKEKFAKIKDSLGEPGASRRAASEIVKFLQP
ncbi:MAG: lipid-A-disaccharide synthase [Candidatus Omnitrophica bacterium]|nr:lipid-A-disaccharide synthase [Candidatus Omnitrophota bacterium]